MADEMIHSDHDQSPWTQHSSNCNTVDIVRPFKAADGLTVDFGNVAVGRYRKKKFQLFNPCPLVQTFFITKFPFPDSGFKLLTSDLPITIAPMTVAPLPMAFKPTVHGNSLEVVHVQNGDGTVKFSICLKGNGYRSPKVIDHGHLWTQFYASLDEVNKTNAATVVQRWWRRYMVRRSVTDKWERIVLNILIRNVAAKVIQSAWKNLQERKGQRSAVRSSVKVIENVVKYHLIRKKWIGLVDKLVTTEKRLDQLMKVSKNGLKVSTEVLSPAASMKVNLHKLNHVRRLESLVSSNCESIKDGNMYQVMKITLAVKVLESFFKYQSIRNKWRKLIGQVTRLDLYQQNAMNDDAGHDRNCDLEESSAIKIQRFFRSYKLRKKWNQVVTGLIHSELRRKEKVIDQGSVVAVNDGTVDGNGNDINDASVTLVLGAIGAIILLYLLTSEYTAYFFWP